jgi:carboxylesterase
MLVNPHLEGDPFYWEGGPVGILLTHGLTATAAEVRPLARLLHARGYTVAGPLLPGHHTTPEDLNTCRWQDWAAAVEKTYQELASRCQTVFLGGESTGAVLALYLAGDHPEAAGILAYAPALRLQLSPLDQLFLNLLAPFKTSIQKPVQNRAPNFSDDLWQGYSVHPLKGVLQLLRLQRVVRERLPDVHQPLLVIQGRLDPTVHPEVPAILSSETGSAVKEVVWLEQSAHCVMIDCEQDQVAALTLQFIERILA